MSIAGKSVSLGGSLSASDLTSALGLSSALRYIGTSTTEITDGGTQNPTISGSVVTTKKTGDVVIYSDAEFVWQGSAWERLGRDSSWKVVQTAKSSPSASGSTTAFIDTISQDANGVITATKKNLDTSGTWSGNAATATTATNLASAGTWA